MDLRNIVKGSMAALFGFGVEEVVVISGNSVGTPIGKIVFEKYPYTKFVGYLGVNPVVENAILDVAVHNYKQEKKDETMRLFKQLNSTKELNEIIGEELREWCWELSKDVYSGEQDVLYYFLKRCSIPEDFSLTIKELIDSQDRDIVDVNDKSEDWFQLQKKHRVTDGNHIITKKDVWFIPDNFLVRNKSSLHKWFCVNNVNKKVLGNEISYLKFLKWCTLEKKPKKTYIGKNF